MGNRWSAKSKCGHFQIDRADDCVWLLDLRSEPGKEGEPAASAKACVHMTADQAADVGHLLSSATWDKMANAQTGQS